MSRSNYSDEIDDVWGHIRWRGAVNAAIQGARGQKCLRELAEAMDAMPVKKLIPDSLEADGQFCALGVLGHARGVDMTTLDLDNSKAIAGAFDIAPAMAREIFFLNDDNVYVDRQESQEGRWKRIRAWVSNQTGEII